MPNSRVIEHIFVPAIFGICERFWLMKCYFWIDQTPVKASKSGARKLKPNAKEFAEIYRTAYYTVTFRKLHHSTKRKINNCTIVRHTKIVYKCFVSSHSVDILFFSYALHKYRWSLHIHNVEITQPCEKLFCTWKIYTQEIRKTFANIHQLKAAKLFLLNLQKFFLCLLLILQRFHHVWDCVENVVGTLSPCRILTLSICEHADEKKKSNSVKFVQLRVSQLNVYQCASSLKRPMWLCFCKQKNKTHTIYYSYILITSHKQGLCERYSFSLFRYDIEHFISICFVQQRRHVSESFAGVLAKRREMKKKISNQNI